jgi:hypothetical protein
MPEANIGPTTDREPPAAETGEPAAAAEGAAPSGTGAGSAPAADTRGGEPAAAGGPSSSDGEAAEGAGAPAAEDAEADGNLQPEAGADEEESPREGLTPRQARRVRIVVSGVVMAAVAVALFVRLGSAPSVLTVGFYGIALILSGTAIGLSRRGRTRVASGVLALGFGSVALAEWLLASVR